MQNGLLLIVGTVVSLIGWMFIYPGGEGTAAEQAAALMADPGLGKLGIVMGMGGMWSVFLALLLIARQMAAAGGPGSTYANVAAIFAMVLATLGVIGVGANLAIMDASSAALATQLQVFNDAMGYTFALACGLLLLLLGIAIVLDKNFHVVVGVLAVASGALFTVTAFLAGDAGDNLGFIAWLGMMLTAVIIGGFSIKQKS